MSESGPTVVDQQFDGAVADAVSRLAGLDALPVNAHADVFERVHAELQAALTNAEPDSAGPLEPG